MTRRTALVAALAIAAAMLPAPGALAAPGDPAIGTYMGGRSSFDPARVGQQPFSVTFDGASRYVSDPVHHVVRRVQIGEGTVEDVFAGNGGMGTSGDGGAAIDAQLAGPYAVAVDPDLPVVYIADTYGHQVRRVSSGGETLPAIDTVAGTTAFGFSGDGGPATNARLNSPYGLAFWGEPALPDGGGPAPNRRSILYVADTLNNRVRAVYLSGTAADGTIATVAGTGEAADGGDGGPALSARLDQPRGLAVDEQGRLLIADTFNNRIRRFQPTFDPASGTISGGTLETLAGTGGAGHAGDGGRATLAELNLPSAIAVGSRGLYVADTANNAVRLVDREGVIRAFAGTGTAGPGGDGGPADAAELDAPFGVAAVPGVRDDVVDIADTGNNLLREVRTDPRDGVPRIGRIAGTGTPGLGTPPDDQALDTPTAVATLAAPGALPTHFLLDTFDHAVMVAGPGREVVPAPLLGDGRPGPAADGPLTGPTHASAPMGIAVDGRPAPGPRLYVADTFNNVVRQVDLSDRSVVTVAGTGVSGFGGDGGAATLAQLSFPTGLAVDRAGNLFIADTYNGRVRRLDAVPSADGTRHISTVAGTGVLGAGGDGGPATAAQLFFPYGVALDPAGDLYVSDSFDNRVRRVDAGTHAIATIAGNGTAAFAGDGGPATAGSLDRPWGLSFGLRAGRPTLYIADYLGHAVRSVDIRSGQLGTIAGRGQRGFAGDGGDATAALVHSPRGVEVAPAGDGLTEISVADSFNDRVRLIGLPVFQATGGDAGEAEVDAFTPFQVLIRNAGTGVITTSFAFVPDQTDFHVESAAACARARLVHGGPGCVIDLNVRPTRTGRVTGTLTVVEEGSGTTHDVPLTAVGTAGGITVRPPSIQFAPQLLNTAGGPRAISVSSTGTAPLRVAGITAAGEAFTMVPAPASPCPAVPFTMPVNAPPCNLAVVFRPPLAGPRAGSVTISSNAAGGPTVIPLSGTGFAEGGIDVRVGADFCPPPQPGGFDCADPSVVGQTVDLSAARGGATTRAFRLISTGPGPLTVSEMTVAGDGQFTLAPTSRPDACRLPPPAFTLRAGPPPRSCTFQVTFANRTGAGEASLVIRHSAGESVVHLIGASPPPGPR